MLHWLTLMPSAAQPAAIGKDAADRGRNPPFWDQKLHGQAHGLFARHQAPTPAKQRAVVEVRPGVLHAVEQRKPQPHAPRETPAQPQGQRRPQRIASAGPRGPSPAVAAAAAAAGARRPMSAAAAAPHHVQPTPSDAALVVEPLEELMRAQLRARAGVAVRDRVVLLRAFGKVRARCNFSALWCVHTA